MASVKLPWERLWALMWSLIPSPLTDGRLLVLLDDTIRAKTAKHIYACQTTFDHAAKTIQTRYPWAQTIVTVGLLKKIHERWCCLPLAFACYLRQKTVAAGYAGPRRQTMVFRTKFEQAVSLIDRVARAFSPAKILVITDSWLENNGLLKPLRSHLGACADILSRVRVNGVLYAIPESDPSRPGRPRKYGSRLGSVADMAEALQAQAELYTLHVHSGLREVMAVDRVVMLKTLRCRVRVVWVYHKRQRALAVGERCCEPSVFVRKIQHLE